MLPQMVNHLPRTATLNLLGTTLAAVGVAESPVSCGDSQSDVIQGTPSAKPFSHGVDVLEAQREAFVQRLQTLLHNSCSAKVTTSLKSAGAKWLLSCAKRSILIRSALLSLLYQ